MGNTNFNIEIKPMDMSFEEVYKIASDWEHSLYKAILTKEECRERLKTKNVYYKGILLNVID